MNPVIKKVDTLAIANHIFELKERSEILLELKRQAHANQHTCKRFVRRYDGELLKIRWKLDSYQRILHQRIASLR